MLTSDRRSRILDIAREKGSVRVVELTELFNVSEVTIRHDLKDLADEGLLIRTHGGAMAQSQTPLDIEFSMRARHHREEKAQIGRVAARLCKPGETVLFDGGSTPLQVARNIKNLDHATFITVSPGIAEVLVSRNLNSAVYITAGELNRRTLAVEGPQVKTTLQGLNIDKVFLAIHGFDIEKGLTELTLSQAFTKKTLIEAGREAILVADSSKLGIIAFATVAPLSAIHTLVTDPGLSSDAVKDIEAQGVRVIITEEYPKSTANR